MTKNMFAFIIHTRWVGRFHWGNPHIAQKQVWLTSNMMRPRSSQCNFLSQRPLNNASNLVPMNWIKVDCLATTISSPVLTSKRSSSATSDICVAIWLRTLEFLWVQLVQLLSNSNFPFIMIMRRAMFCLSFNVVTGYWKTLVWKAKLLQAWLRRPHYLTTSHSPKLGGWIRCFIRRRIVRWSGRARFHGW